MYYLKNFQITDDMINHLNTVINSVGDAFIESRYIGFVAISAVTVYELSIKEIFLKFSKDKHKVLANFSESYFARINGRIKTKTIRDDYISRYGERYVKRFDKKLNQFEATNLRNHGVSVRSSYNNIVEWRNQFAHEGVIPSYVTYNEIIKSYEYGKNVIQCLAETMRR